MRINCLGKLIDLSQPKIMGILNLTQDSFYEGSRVGDLDNLVKRTEKLLNEGADFIDLGGMSTRPGALEISLEEELNKVIPAIERLVKEFPGILISVDTYRAKVAKKSIEAGAALINDISAGNLDEDLLKTVGELKVPYILMHMQGTPQNMQKDPKYDNVLIEVNQFLSDKIQVLRSFGVNDIILDPGFGLWKSCLEHNYTLMKQLHLIGMGEFPLLVGISRKSMVTKLLDISAQDALNATSVLHAFALQNGANILRVHDVKEAQETIRIWEQMQN
ncbi:MAG TPA: dihydropteroate synthase [Moheibacter sp.]|nr:dihydropteroate synthase [Moheibacter sp.]